MRLFVAVVPPPEVVEHLAEFLEPRRAAEGPRWSPSEHWHLTLAFMAAAPERVLDELTQRLGEAVSGRPAVDLAVAGGGCFPDVTRARVLWAGVRGGDALTPVSRAVRAACGVAGAAPEGGPFRPHLTLARFGRPRDATRWVRVLETYEGPPWRAGEVVLVQSHLPREPGRRPRHQIIARVSLT